MTGYSPINATANTSTTVYFYSTLKYEGFIVGNAYWFHLSIEEVTGAQTWAAAFINTANYSLQWTT